MANGMAEMNVRMLVKFMIHLETGLEDTQDSLKTAVANLDAEKHDHEEKKNAVINFRDRIAEIEKTQKIVEGTLRDVVRLNKFLLLLPPD